MSESGTTIQLQSCASENIDVTVSFFKKYVFILLRLQRSPQPTTTPPQTPFNQCQLALWKLRNFQHFASHIKGDTRDEQITRSKISSLYFLDYKIQIKNVKHQKRESKFLK